MTRVLALAAVVFFAAPVAADDKDWTGKAIRLKFDNTKMGSKRGNGLVRDGAALDGSKIYVVESDSGNFLELAGQTGYIFKSVAGVVADRDVPKKDDPAPTDKKNLWAAGTTVLPKKETKKIQFADRDADGKLVYFEVPLPSLHVRQDRGDGWVRVHDGQHEGWIIKDDLITTEDAPLFFDKAVKDNPKSGFALYMRAVAWDKKGEFDNAIKDYTEYIRLRPFDAAAYGSRGIAWSEKKEYDKAIKDFNAVILISPKSAIGYYNRGRTWSNKKEYDKAIADYTEAIRLDPKYQYAYLNRGNAWSEKEEYDKAITDYTEAIRLAPKDGAAYFCRGYAWDRKKEYDKAIQDYTNAIELDPRNALAYSNRGNTWRNKKEYGKAIADYTEVIRLDPKDAVAHSTCGWLVATCPDAKYRDGKQAVELAKKAIELAGKDASWHYHGTLAAAHAEAGDFELAISEQRKALDDKSLDAADRKKMEARLELYRAKKPYRDDE